MKLQVKNNILKRSLVTVSIICIALFIHTIFLMNNITGMVNNELQNISNLRIAHFRNLEEVGTYYYTKVLKIKQPNSNICENMGAKLLADNQFVFKYQTVLSNDTVGDRYVFITEYVLDFNKVGDN